MNLSPALAWSGAPPDTGSFVLVVEDPDAPAGMFGHWGIANIRGTSLIEGAGTPATEDQARNGFGNRHYDGPAPPRLHGVHHYHFRLAALPVERIETETVSVGELWRLAQAQALAETELVGTYERR
jgi:Raf kinase inhibitor-like YbhB/YbcL family protein